MVSKFVEYILPILVFGLCLTLLKNRICNNTIIINIMEHGTWSMEHGAWNMEHGAWSMEHGAWSMEHGRAYDASYSAAVVCPDGHRIGIESVLNVAYAAGSRGVDVSVHLSVHGAVVAIVRVHESQGAEREVIIGAASVVTSGNVAGIVG